ncbi:MAG: TatD family hydrolase [Armatimonadota bacterium]|nr:TatD family hydrolase [bacterium]
MYLIDTHAHLNDEQFAQDLDNVVARAVDTGVERIVVCGYDVPSSEQAVKIASRFNGVFATVGVHPHDAKNYDEQAHQRLVELSREDKVLAIGEIGLDFHYDLSPREDQFKVFDAQISLAWELGLPIVVHSRESNPEVMQVLSRHAGNIRGCVIHCFSGDEGLAREVLDAGFYIGIDGPITYKASQKLRRVVAMCPLDRLLIETDCPYLTPVPYRGKRNEPAYVKFIAEEIARIKEITIEELAEATSNNARIFFGGIL